MEMKFSRNEFIRRYKAEYGEYPKENIVAIAECIAGLYEQGYEKEVKAFVAGMKTNGAVIPHTRKGVAEWQEKNRVTVIMLRQYPNGCTTSTATTGVS